MTSMLIDIVVAEIGSTTTVLSAFGGIGTDRPVLLGQGLHTTTVGEDDVMLGVRAALKSLESRLGAGKISIGEMRAASSAAGGLRMTVHGLVHDMTVKAAKEAALGAGALPMFVTAGDLSDSDIDRIKAIRPNIILLAGGVDYGEKATVIANAKRLARSGIAAPVVYAGNVAAQEQAEQVLREAGIRVIAAENVYPRIDDLNVEPTRNAIQRVFEEHITEAPGMEKVRSMIKGRILPTPGAVMNAALALYEQIGDLMAIDVGGATTDVHSVTEGSPEVQQMLTSPEPKAKRTVEGDLGIFINAPNVARKIGETQLKGELGFDPAPVLARKKVFPDSREEIALVERLALWAVTQAVRRHAGSIHYLYGPSGRMTVARGKDLTRVKYICGTGGPLTRLPGARAILETLLKKSRGTELWPKDARVVLDQQYIMAACGVLATDLASDAVRLLKQSLGVEG